MAQGYLTTHVLDTARGTPANGLRVALFRIVEDEPRIIAERLTNADGRTNKPILPEEKFAVGTYELVFHVGDYLRRTGQITDELPFLDAIPIRFGISDEDAHYHVPLLLSPYGYSTYRGS